MLMNLIFLVAGLAVLVFAGDMLIKGSVGLAEKLSIPPLIIGLTVVAFGTSAPELFISVQAALWGSSGIAIGNIVGSNIANVLLVIGIPALIAPSRCDDAGVGRNILVMLGFSVVFMAMLAGGTLNRIEGVILLLLLAAFLFDQFKSARQANSEVAASLDYHDEVSNIPHSNAKVAVLILLGLIGLPLGADITVDSSVEIARRLNVSEEAIGLTIVAIGTSLPELVTSLMAVVRSSSSIAIGNVVGSNIFNIGSIMGIASLISPMSVGGNIARVDMWVMLACALLVGFLAHWKIKIGKRVGVAMTTAYAIYAAVAFVL